MQVPASKLATLLGAILLLAHFFPEHARAAVPQTDPEIPQTAAAATRTGSEPPRVRAARRFLARRGLLPGPGRPNLRLAQARKPTPPRPQAAASASAWTSVGPVGVNSLNYGLVTGRVSAIALDPSDATGNHVFVGTTGGGLWKSQNAAASTPSSIQFLPITDNLGALSGAMQAGLSVGAVAVEPGGTGVVLAGLGDPNDALDSYYGAGLLRSTDNGQTWTLIQQTSDLESGLGTQDYGFVGEGFAGFAWSTANPQLVVAAVSQAYQGTLVNASLAGQSHQGLYWSSDGGATWHFGRITDLNGEDVQGPLDGYALPDGNAATSVVWNPIRQVFLAAVRYHGYYQSTDGMNWTQLANQPGTGLTPSNCPTEPGSTGVAGCPIFRGSLAVNPQTGDTFAWTVDAFNQDQGIWQDQCAIAAGACGNQTIAFGAHLNTAALETSDQNGPATIENGDYNLTLAAVPSAPGLGQDTLLFAGGNDLWKCSLANSCQWRNTTNSTTCASAQVGEYQHGFAWDAGNSQLLFLGTDSGLWRSTDLIGETGSPCATADASHFQNLNGSLGSLAEVESLAQSANSAATMLAGLGANGFAGIVNASSTPGNWNQVLGGEGGPVAIDQNSTINNWYANNAAGVSILNCDSTTPCTPAAFGTAPVIGETQVEDDGYSMPYPAEFRLDSLDRTQVLVGTCRVWRGPASGLGWSATNAISPILDGTSGIVCNGNALIRSIAVSAISTPSGSGEVIYAGMAGAEDGGGVVPGHVFKATVSNSGAVSAWTDLALSPVVNNGLAFNAFGLDVSSLYIDPHDATGSTVYATVSGFSNSSEPVQQVYQSTNGGANWTSIQSNLPDAPANAVVVDSNDPNTVYVATDVGVFSTRAIGTCGQLSGSGAACWSQYGTGLPLAPVVSLVATPTNASSQVLTAGTYGRGIWQIPSATAGLAATTATLSPTSLTFAARTIGTASTAQSITLKVTGTPSLTVTGAVFTGTAAADYTETGTCVGFTLAKNSTCQFNVSFTPTATGSRLASLAIQANVAGGQLLVPLTGTGLATASVALTPSSASFGSQQVGTTSATQTFNLQNTGGSSLTVNSIAVTAPFLRTASSCGATLAANTGCAVTVAFAPTLAGAATGTLTVTDSVGVQTAPLSGTGVAAPTDALSTNSLAFPSTVLGQTSPPLIVTLTNNGGLPLTGIGTSVSDTLSNSDFTAVSDCGGQLAPQSSCGIVVEFAPTVALTENGTLLISDALKAQSVHLTGSGLKPPLLSLSPASLAFGSQPLGLPSAVRTVTVANKGGSPLATPSFSFAGAGAASFSAATTTCTASVPAGGVCTVGVVFTPTAAGATTAILTVATSSPGVASAPVALSGTGLAPPVLQVSPSSLNLGSVVVGNTSLPFTVQITNAGQQSMALPTFALSGFSGPAGGGLADFTLAAPTDIAACTGALAPAATCNVQIVFSPSAAGLESATLTVTATNAIPSTATVAIMGTGAPPIILQANVLSLEFPATPVGTTASPLSATVSNLGRQTANGLALTVSGPYRLAPGITTCGSKLSAASSCSVGVNFTPTASGNQPGTLTVSVTNLGVAALSVPLDGSGTAVGGISASPTQLTFGSAILGTASLTQTLTVTNSGQAALTGILISATAGFQLIGNTCPTTLAAGATCTTGVQMTPSTIGLQSGTLTVLTSSAGVADAVVPLTGNGIPAGSMSVAPSVLSFGSLTVGQTSPPQQVTVTNSGATTLAGLTFKLAGDYALSQNNCGSQLTTLAICTFSVSFSPSAPGTRIGSVTIQSTNVGFTPVVLGLTGTGLPAAELTVSPPQLAFGQVAVGLSSSPMQLTVANPGTGTLTGLSLSTAAPFGIGTGNCGASLAAGASCTAPVTFAPTAGGPQTGTVTVATTSLGVAAVTVPASGTGVVPPALSLRPPALAFGGTTLGKSSPGQTVTVSNSGGAGLVGLTLSLSGTAAGDFAIASSNCGSTLTAGQSCSAVVTFNPSIAGGRQAFLTAASTTTGVAAVTASLNGSGLTPAILGATPAQLSFPTTLIGQISPAQTLVIANSGQSAIADLQVAVTGPFALLPAQTTCTAALAGGASCIAAVQFAPTSGGALSGSLTASSMQSGAAPATAALSGTGAYPPGIVTLPAALVQFGTTGVGQAGQPVPVTVTNSGTLSAVTGLSLAVDAIGTANGFGLAANTCGTTLAPGATCTVNVTFAPTFAPQSAEALNGTLTFASNNGGIANLALAGIAFNLTFNVSGSSSLTVVQGQTAYYTLAVTPQGATAGSVRFVCGTLPANALCVFNPAQLNNLSANVSGNVILGISSGAPATADRGRPTWAAGALTACCLIGLPLAFRRKQARRWLLLWIGAAAIVSLASCAGAGGSSGSGGQNHAGGGTPLGTYPVTVTATSNGVSKNVNLTWIVN